MTEKCRRLIIIKVPINGVDAVGTAENHVVAINQPNPKSVHRRRSIKIVINDDKALGPADEPVIVGAQPKRKSAEYQRMNQTTINDVELHGIPRKYVIVIIKMFRLKFVEYKTMFRIPRNRVAVLVAAGKYAIVITNPKPKYADCEMLMQILRSDADVLVETAGKCALVIAWLLCFSGEF